MYGTYSHKIWGSSHQFIFYFLFIFLPPWPRELNAHLAKSIYLVCIILNCDSESRAADWASATVSASCLDDDVETGGSK